MSCNETDRDLQNNGLKESFKLLNFTQKVSYLQNTSKSPHHIKRSKHLSLKCDKNHYQHVNKTVEEYRLANCATKSWLNHMLSDPLQRTYRLFFCLCFSAWLCCSSLSQRKSLPRSKINTNNALICLHGFLNCFHAATSSDCKVQEPSYDCTLKCGPKVCKQNQHVSIW